MKCGPDDYASYCDQKMTRTKRNGSRKQPPNSLELQVCAFQTGNVPINQTNSCRFLLTLRVKRLHVIGNCRKLKRSKRFLCWIELS